MKVRSVLLATVSSFAIAGAAAAADLPMKAPARVAVAPPPLWAGAYFGVSVGVARHDSSMTDTFFDEKPLFENGSSWTDSDTSVIIGPHIGYNWQDGSFVYGVEADWSWLGAKQTVRLEGARFGWGDGNPVHVTSKIDWLATFRGRAGLALDRTMAYVTGGLAVGRVKFSGRDTSDPADTFSASATRLGWVAGGGLERIISPNFTVRAEVLYADLGRWDKNFVVGNEGTYSAAFTNSLTTARVGLTYKW